METNRVAHWHWNDSNRRSTVSVTVHIPIRTLTAFQRIAHSQNRSESDLAQEAFELVCVYHFRT